MIKKIIIAITVIILIILGGAYFSTFKNKTSNVDKSVNVYTGTLQKESVGDLMVGVQTDTQYLTNSIKQSALNIARTISENDYSKDSVDRKLVYYQLLATSNSDITTAEKKDAVISAYNGLFDVYSNIKKDPGIVGDYLFTRNLVVSRNIFYFSCYIPEWFISSKWSSDAEYVTVRNTYGTGTLSVLMFFNSLLDKQLFSDKYVNSIRIFTVAQILHNFKDKLNLEVRTDLTAKLKRLIESQNTEQPTKMYTYTLFTDVMPAVYTAYGYEVLAKYDKNITAAMVKDNYLKTIAFVELNIKSKTDRSQESLIFLNNIYMGFLFENNNNKTNGEISALINKNMEMNDNLMSSDQDVAKAAKNFYSAINTDMGNWDLVRTRLYQLGKQESLLKKYLENYGVVYK